MRPLQVGLILPQWSGSMDGATPRWNDTLTVAREAEDAGFDSLWLADDLVVRLAPDDTLGMWECWSFLAAVAASTQRVGLGTLVCSINFRNPALLAKAASTVNEISGGRLTLGLGTGGDYGEHNAFGFPWEGRFGRLEEAIPLVRRLLAGESVTHQGKHFNLDECELVPLSRELPAPPIMIGTVTPGPRVLGMVARHADVWNCWLAFGHSSPSAVPELREAVDAACAAEGRDPATLTRTVAVGVRLDGSRLAFGASWDISDGALTGEPEQIAEAFSGFADEGISHLQVYLAPLTPAGIERFNRTLEYLDKA